MSLTIFDQYGKPRRDLFVTDEKAIADLSDAARETLMMTVKSVSARDACEARVVEARKSVRSKEAAYNEAVMAYDQTTPADDMSAEAKRHPKHTFEQDAQRIANIKKVSAAQHAGYKSVDEARERVEALAKSVAKLEASHAKLTKAEKPDTVAIAKAADALSRARAALEADPATKKGAMDAASVALTDARAELTKATGELRSLEIKASTAILAWMKVQGAPTADENIRAHINAATAERARRVANGESAEPVKPASAKSELDRVLNARGRVATNRTPTYHGPR